MGAVYLVVELERGRSLGARHRFAAGELLLDLDREGEE